GVATLNTTFSTTGIHSLTAVYSGNSNFTTSTGSLSETVNKAPTTTTVTSSSATFGAAPTFTATITPPGYSGQPAMAGIVQFKVGSALLGSSAGTWSSGSGTGTATYVATGLLAGTGQTVTATYLGDPNYATSSGTYSLDVSKRATSTSISSSSP